MAYLRCTEERKKKERKERNKKERKKERKERKKKERLGMNSVNEFCFNVLFVKVLILFNSYSVFISKRMLRSLSLSLSPSSLREQLFF